MYACTHVRTLPPHTSALDTLQAQAIAVWQRQQIQGGRLSHGRMLATPGAMARACLTHEQQAAMHAAGGIPPMHHPQLCWLPPQMASMQLQIGMQPQMHHGAAVTGSPQHQLYQQHQQHPQHPQYHQVGGCSGRSSLQPAQLGSPQPFACADALSDAHISEQVMHLLSS